MKDNKPIIIGIVIIVVALIAGIYVASNSTYAIDKLCPYGWKYDAKTNNCENQFEDKIDGTVVVKAEDVCKEELESLGIKSASCNAYGIGSIESKNVGEGITRVASFYTSKGQINGSTKLTCEAYNENDICVINGLPTVTNDNSIFRGWSLTSSCSNLENSELLLTSDSSFYACWEEKIQYANIENPDINAGHYYNIEYDLDGGTFPDGLRTRKIVITENEATNQPKYNPIKKGYVFVGWYDGDTKYDFENKVTSDLVLTAKYEKEEAQSNYTCDDGDMYDPSIDKCVKIEKYDDKPYFTSTYNATLSCEDGIYKAVIGDCVGGCDKQQCPSGYQSDVYVASNTCLNGSSCTSSPDTCKIEWRAHCYKTYDAKLIDEDVEEDIEQVPTGDVGIYIVWIVGLFALCYSIVYFRKLKKTEM